MSAALLACLSIGLGVTFDVQTIPLERQDAWVMLAPVDSSPEGDMLICDGLKISAYSGGTMQLMGVINLEPGTSRFDVADVDGDGASELIAVTGQNVMRYAFPSDGGTAASPQVLFSAPSLLSAFQKSPAPSVLVVPLDGRAAIALPCETAMELRTPDGAVAASYPVSTETGKGPFGGKYSAATTVNPSVMGRPAAIEREVSIQLRGAAELPEALTFSKVTYWQTQTARRAGRGRLIDWPWFPLKTTREKVPRALFAYVPPDNQLTEIRIAATPPPEIKPGAGTALAPLEDDPSIGKGVKYGGQSLVSSRELADFNRDGYTDLVFWKSSTPGITTDLITRAATGGTLKVDLMARVFNPTQNRYDSVPISNFECFVPVFRMLANESPIIDFVLRDIDGDGRSDFGCVNADNTFSIWLFGDNGFPAAPDFTRKFPLPIYTSLRIDLELNGRTAIALRSEKELYVVSAK